MTLGEFLPLVAIAAIFWLLLIRPALARRRAQAALIASLASGQEVMTTAGVFGTIVRVDGDRVSLEIAPGVVVEMVSLGVARIMQNEAPSDVVDLAASEGESGAAEEPLPPVDGSEPDRG